MSAPLPTIEYGDDNGREPDLKTIAEDSEQDAAYHWRKIMENLSLIEAQVADLKDLCKDFRTNSMFLRL